MLVPNPALVISRLAPSQVAPQPNRPPYFNSYVERPDERETNLAAMCVTSEDQRDIVGNGRRHVGAVREQNARPRQPPHRSDGRGDVVMARECVVRTAEAERSDLRGLVRQQLNPCVVQRSRHLAYSAPMVVVSKDGVSPKRRAKLS